VALSGTHGSRCLVAARCKTRQDRAHNLFCSPCPLVWRAKLASTREARASRRVDLIDSIAACGSRFNPDSLRCDRATLIDKFDCTGRDSGRFNHLGPRPPSQPQMHRWGRGSNSNVGGPAHTKFSSYSLSYRCRVTCRSVGSKRTTGGSKVARRPSDALTFHTRGWSAATIQRDGSGQQDHGREGSVRTVVQ
jgi:hypothetical protein